MSYDRYQRTGVVVDVRPLEMRVGNESQFSLGSLKEAHAGARLRVCCR